jgi:hypothetical protein
MAYIGNRPLVGRYQVLDNITFNGSNTQYSLTVGGQPVLPGSAQNLLISVGGVLQAPSNAYSVSGSNILFTGAPAANAAFFGVQLGDVYGVATVANTGYTSLRQQFTASNGQTQFAISGGYVPGQVDVYRNGIKLVNGQDTNISSGANVVLSSAAANNDTIDVIGAQQITIGGATTMVRQQFTTTNNQTQFAITNGYTPGMIDVYLNGIKQIPGTDVNVSSGSNVVFNVATVNNSVVDVTGYQALSVYNGYTFRSGDTMTGTLSAPAFYANNGATDVAGYISPQPTMRNRIINGDMRIYQRSLGTVSPINTDALKYTIDRWWAYNSTSSSKFSIQQSTDAPAGFSNSLLITSLSSYTVAAADEFDFGHLIEGFNFSDMAWGTSSAKTITLSFWVKSSLIGTFGGSLMNNAYNRSYPFTYTINSANTWEQKSLTINGDTSGTWVGATNGIGLRVIFGIGIGTNKSGTAGSWATAEYETATGATSIVGTSGATFYITGVQLESGSYATPFERRNYQQELAMCQRYYQTWNPNIAIVGMTTNLAIPLNYIVTMRTVPTCTIPYTDGTFTSSGSPTGALWNPQQVLQTAATKSGTITFTWVTGSTMSGIIVATGATFSIATNWIAAGSGIGNIALTAEL